MALLNNGWIFKFSRCLTLWPVATFVLDTSFLCFLFVTEVKTTTYFEVGVDGKSIIPSMVYFGMPKRRLLTLSVEFCPSEEKRITLKMHHHLECQPASTILLSLKILLNRRETKIFYYYWLVRHLTFHITSYNKKLRKNTYGFAWILFVLGTNKPEMLEKSKISGGNHYSYNQFHCNNC